MKQEASAPQAIPSPTVEGASKQEAQPQPKHDTQVATAAKADKRNDTALPGDAGKSRPAAEPKSKTQRVVPATVTPTKSEGAKTNPPSKSVGAPEAVSPGTNNQPTSNASVSREPKPPGTESALRTPAQEPTRPDPRSEIAIANIPSPPKPTMNPPTAVSVSPDRSGSQPETLAASVPTRRIESAPSPLVLQLESAIKSNTLIEPRNSSAWDFYQRLTSEPEASADVARLRPMLAAALGEQGRAIVSGDVRGDNISDRVDDFKRAGQLFARARSLSNSTDVAALEKLSAAEALISLQFYDEAERALTQLQDAKLAAVENAFGLVYHGKLDSFRAERAFKRAIEIDPKWAAPHYNLALVYRSQQKQESLAELEAAAALDPNNVNVVAALAEEYFTRQQFKQSADTYRKAVSLKPSDDSLHTKLGHALYSQGLQDEANREYQKAKELRGKQP
jgi:tetratricopeptide (TPR) repeat protein